LFFAGFQVSSNNYWSDDVDTQFLPTDKRYTNINVVYCYSDIWIRFWTFYNISSIQCKIHAI